MRLGALLLGLLISTQQPKAAAADLSADAALRDHLWSQLRALPKEKRPRVGIAFSAGSLRAVSHVGVVYALENAGFPIDVVAGTSMGAIMGALYAGGRPIRRLWQIASTIKVSSGSNLNTVSLLRLVLSDKLLSSRETEKFIRDEIGAQRIEDLPKPFACVAMDLTSGEAIIFRNGPLAPAVRASMNLPGIFEPVEYRHRYLVDGGVVAYIPVEAARLIGAEWLIASVTEPDYTRSKPETVLQALEQVIDIRGSLLARQQRKLADFVIEPAVGDIGMYESHRVGEAINKGVMASHKKIAEAQKSYVLFSMRSLLKEFAP